MILKFFASLRKEAILMLRDIAGLAILFIMPMALILIMTLLQDNTFKALEENKIDIILVNNDAGELGQAIEKGLDEADFFDITDSISDKQVTAKQAYSLVANGKYQMAIVIPADATSCIRNNVTKQIASQIPDLAEYIPIDSTVKSEKLDIQILFDPITKSSFKTSIQSALMQFTSKIESQLAFKIYGKIFKEHLEIDVKEPENFGSLITFSEKYATNEDSRIIPNSVQHNVPAWTLFAMFFIVIPLAGNIIKERESGSVLRLKTMPGSYSAVLLGKISIYFFIGLIQAALMISIGVFVLPLFGLPSLVLGSNFIALFAIVAAAALAAVGFGVLIGTIATTHEQASIFGAVSTVILAALGGIWVPTFIMPEIMRKISVMSPMNWALNGFYDIFLRDSDIYGIAPYIGLLILFFGISVAITYLYNKYNRSIS
ncbi:MAG: ABC transporter permease [Bacteroidales bacterium]|nr:ABC transporter permease [Bacteroidales bacterium]